MMCFKKLFAAFSILITVVSITTAKNLEEKQFDYGVAIGPWLAGNFSVDALDKDVKKPVSPLLKVYADSYLTPKFAMGLFLSYSSMEWKYNSTSSYWENYEEIITSTDQSYDISMYELGASLKPRFIVSPQVVLKPALSFSYRKLSSSYKYAKGTAMGINGSLEVQYHISDPLYYFGEFGVMSQPVGGNKDTNIISGPILYLLFGVGL